VTAPESGIPMPGPTLVGRERELALIDERLALIGESGGTLVLRGEAGVGKSALLTAARSSAVERGLATLTTAGFQSESHVAFAGLHRLLRPLMGAIDGLPAPQRTAMQAAFGLNDMAPADFFLVALAVLDMLCEAAVAKPLLIVVEDAQLLDVATSDVLLFVSRRLELEPIMMVFAVRDGSTTGIDRAGLPELQLEPLDDAAAGALLDATSPGIEPGVRRRILAEALGNPLALVELPQAASGFELLPASPLPLTDRLERAFATRMSRLPAPARALLLVTALDDGGDQERLVDAAATLAGEAVGAAEIAAAKAAQAVSADGDGLRFRHPLMRSAVYQAALASERRAAHAALAGVYKSDPDRTIWHQAASLAGPDNQIAGELELMAERSAGRGATTTAVAALERAARLAGDAPARGRLLLRAACLSYDQGHLDASNGLVRDAQRLQLAHRERVMLRYMLAVAHENMWSDAAGIRSLAEISWQLQETGETGRAVDALELSSLRCWWSNPDQPTRDLVVAAAARLTLAADNPRLLAIIAQADPVKNAADVIHRISRMTPDGADPEGMLSLGLAASAVWAFDLGLLFLNAAVTGLRAQGRLGLLAQAVAAQAWAAVHLAREPLAVSAAEEAIALARETGQQRWAVVAQLAKAAIAAERGDFGAAEDLVREAEAVLLPLGEGSMLALAQFVRGRGAVAHQHYEEGLEHLGRVLNPADPAYHRFIGTWGLSDLVEAATHTGNTDAALTYLMQLETLAAETTGSLLWATSGYARPIAADDDAAEALYQQAIGNDLANWHCYRGRMLLWYGRWLRRQRRAADSRAPLRAALDGFEALAFPALAEVARLELRASGVAPRRHLPEAWAQLTPQELQIAQMAAAGHTNRAIGQRLYLSPRTIQSHMYNIFPKLGITGRNQLRDVFAGLEPAY
jgi:DNA-binding CsgD family transcriptional regulator